MPKITGVKKNVIEYTVKLSAIEMKCIVEVIGNTSVSDREKAGCTEKEAETGDGIYDVFVDQLRSNGIKVNGLF